MNYTNYIRELNSTIDRFEEARRNYPDFDRIVTQFEVAFLSSATSFEECAHFFCIFILGPMHAIIISREHL